MRWRLLIIYAKLLTWGLGLTSGPLGNWAWTAGPYHAFGGAWYRAVNKIEMLHCVKKGHRWVEEKEPWELGGNVRVAAHCRWCAMPKLRS